MNYTASFGRAVVSIVTLAILTVLLTTAAAQGELNPLIHYFIDGKTVSPWRWVAGNESNYYVPLGAGEGQSEDGALTVSLVDDAGGRNAIRAVFNKDNEGTYLYLHADAIDLSEYENAVAVAADIRFEKKPKNLDMTISMDCEYPCRGAVDVGRNMRSKPKHEWFTFPIPLNCFSAEGADLGKVRSPLMIRTASEVTISVSDVRIVLLPKGEKGCAK